MTLYTMYNFMLICQLNSTQLETHLLHWTGRVFMFRIVYRNTLFPLFCHVVDLLQLLLTALLRVQQCDFIELLDICENKMCRLS